MRAVVTSTVTFMRVVDQVKNACRQQVWEILCHIKLCLLAIGSSWQMVLRVGFYYCDQGNKKRGVLLHSCISKSKCNVSVCNKV